MTCSHSFSMISVYQWLCFKCDLIRSPKEASYQCEATNTKAGQAQKDFNLDYREDVKTEVSIYPQPFTACSQGEVVHTIKIQGSRVVEPKLQVQVCALESNEST